MEDINQNQVNEKDMHDTVHPFLPQIDIPLKPSFVLS